MEKKNQIARRTTVIKGSFQTRYVTLTVIFIGALTLLIFLDFSWYLQDAVLGNPARPDLPEIFSKASWIFFARFGLYLVSSILFLYVLFHGLAGPIVRFRRLAQEVAGGDLSQRVRLRDNDGLKDLQDDLNKMLDSLTGTLKADRQKVESAIRDLEWAQSQPLPPEIQTRLQSIRSSLSETLNTLKM